MRDFLRIGDPSSHVLAEGSQFQEARNPLVGSWFFPYGGFLKWGKFSYSHHPFVHRDSP